MILFPWVKTFETRIQRLFCAELKDCLIEPITMLLHLCLHLFCDTHVYLFFGAFCRGNLDGQV